MGGSGSSHRKVSPRSLKLTYFNVRGRAETVRWILAYAGQRYEDKRVEQSDWPALKPQTLLGSMPFLEIDGKTTIAQNGAIISFLAKEFDLAGCTSLQEAQVQMLVETIFEVFNAGGKAFFIADPDEKAKQIQVYTDVEAPRVLKVLTQYLRGNKWLVGNRLTAADIAVSQVFGEPINEKIHEKVADFPEVAALIKRVQELPNIKRWIANRPKTPI